MNQDDRHIPSQAPTADAPSGAAPEQPASSETPPATDDVTVGTGSVIALGCIAGTVLLILIGLLYLAIIALL